MFFGECRSAMMELVSYVVDGRIGDTKMDGLHSWKELKPSSGSKIKPKKWDMMGVSFIYQQIGKEGNTSNTLQHWTGRKYID